MAFTLNRRLSQLVDSNGQLNTGKIANDYITSDHIANNTVTSAMLHTSFTVAASNLTSIDTDAVSEGSTNLYYTDSRVDTRVGTYISGNRTFGNITTTGYIAGPATFTIDPAAVGDNTGTVVIAGNLQVDGTTTTINSTTMTVDDKNIILASGSANAAAANGAGLTVDGANAELVYTSVNDTWGFNKVIKVTTGATTTASITAEEASGATIRMAAGGSSAFIGTMSNHYLRFLVNSQERASLTAGGDFTVTNDLKLTTTNARIDYDGGNTGALRFFSTSANREQMRIDSSGNVGIGCTPSNWASSVYDALQIGESIGIGGLISRRDGINNVNLGLNWYYDGGSYNKYIGSSFATNYSQEGGTHRWYYAASGTADADFTFTEAMRIDSSGNLGLGTNSPAVRLHSHNTTGSPEIRLTTGLDTGTPMSQIGYSSGSGYFLRLGDSSNNEDVMFRTYGDSYIANNLGIGVASPDQKFHVNSGGTNVVARFESTDAIGGIMLKDNTGNVELETYGGAFRVNPSGLSNPISFSSGADSNYFMTNTAHSGTNQDFDFVIQNMTASNQGPRVRIYGGGQSSGVSADVPWDNQQGYNTGSLWFDSGEGPSIYGAGIAGVAEVDFNGNDTPAALAFYTTPDGTGGQTNTAKERFRLRADGTAHLSPTESNTHLYLGSAGGLTGGNNSINIRAAGNNMMLNSVGQLIVESTGVQKFLVDEVYTKVTTNTTDRYNLRVESSSTGDPGLSMWRAGQAGFGINVRTSSTNYADFMVSTGGEPAYNAAGTTNAPIRIYQNNNVSFPHSATWSTGIGNTFGATGNHYMIRNSNSTGNETIIVNNTLNGGSTGILQYRESAGIRGDYLVASSASGIYFAGGSDYRFKENVTNLPVDALSKICELRPITYTHSSNYDDDTSTVHKGLIAHEVQDVFPEFVEGEKDAVYTQEDLDARGDPETTDESVGDPKYQTVSYTRKEWNLYFIKAIQQLKAENDALRARIEVLEG